MRSRLEPASLERRPTVALAAQRVAPREEAAAFHSPPPAEKARLLKPSLLWTGGLLGLSYLFFEDNLVALLPIVSLFGLDALWRHLDNQSLILKELRRLRRAQLPAGSESTNL